jgi:hypothetical protein
VAQGFTQKPGTDFSNTGTFTPVMQFETLRTLLTLPAVEDGISAEWMSKWAYVNGRLTGELYMKQPIGLEDGTGRVDLSNPSMDSVLTFCETKKNSTLGHSRRGL